jgi:hypothetical protein
LSTAITGCENRASSGNGSMRSGIFGTAPISAAVTMPITPGIAVAEPIVSFAILP